MELVSVIMGVYNNLDTVEQAMASIFAQDYPSIELIVCDDCSTDGSAERVAAYQSAHPEASLTLLRNTENRGLANALNRCLAHCSGTWIARMDADDVSLPQRISTQVGFLQEHPEFDLVGCALKVADETGAFRIRSAPGEAKAETLRRDVPFAHPAVLVRRGVYEALNGYCEAPEVLLCEDTELWFRFFHAGFRGYNLPDVLFVKRETMTDYRKRTFTRALRTARVRKRGFDLLHFPWYTYPLLAKPLVAALLPDRLMMWYHKRGAVCL